MNGLKEYKTKLLLSMHKEHLVSIMKSIIDFIEYSQEVIFLKYLQKKLGHENLITGQ